MNNSIVQNESQTTVANQPRNEQYLSPDVNIYETQQGYVLEAEMPGVSKEGLEITLDAHEITIVGRRSQETPPGQTLFHERHGADYRRVFEVDSSIDASRISARMNQGVLYLTLPKAEVAKPRKISVGE